jgi:D-beta-D-heptose 7-phosphate kinase/D-beta-D-heptose 1-phosphate adenosyltransferase
MLNHHPLFDAPVLQPELLEPLIDLFAGKRILVVGDLILDEYLIGEVRRISPEAPVPVVEITHRAHIPGGAANVAANIAGLGGEPVLLGVVGRDENASCLEAVLKSNHIGTDALITAFDRPTTTKTRIVSGHQQIVRIDREVKRAISGALAEEILSIFSTALKSVDACVLSDYAKGLLTPSICQQMISRAKTQGKLLVADPKGTDFSKYAGCGIITPNLRETELAANTSIQNDADLSVAADRLHTTLGDDSALLVTRGADGMTLFRRGRSTMHVAALAQEVFDVTGAGDTVVSTLTLALGSGASLENAIQLSNLAASLVVRKTGTATVSTEELRHALAPDGNSELATTTTLPAAGRSYLAVPNQMQLV